jgi:hypothetical protein
MGSTNPTLNPHAIRKSRLTSIDRVVEPRRAATDVRSGAAGTNAAAPTSTSESAATLIRGIPFEKPTSPTSLDRWVLSSELAAEPKSSTT